MAMVPWIASIYWMNILIMRKKGGFGSYLIGMSEVVAKESNEDNAAENTKNPTLGWLIGFVLPLALGCSQMYLFARLQASIWSQISPPRLSPFMQSEIWKVGGE